MNSIPQQMILFDIDNTLVYGSNAQLFYREYSRLLEETIARELTISKKEAVQIANDHRARFNGCGEKAFETHHIPEHVWYDALCTLNPEAYLKPLPRTNELLRFLNKRNMIVGAITDGPEAQIDRICRAAHIDTSLFAFLIGWKRGKQKPKNGSSTIFTTLCSERSISETKTIMVGDSLHTDIFPSLQAGLSAIHINSPRPSSTEPTAYKQASSIESIIPLIISLLNL